MHSKIRVLFPRNPPDVFDTCAHFPSYTPTIGCLFPGWTLEIIMSIAQALQLEVEPVFMEGVPGSMNWGSSKNGTWDGALGFLQENKVDLVSVLFQQTPKRMRDFKYSYPVTSIQEVINVRAVDSIGDTTSIWRALKPYDNLVWGIFLLSLVLQAVMLILVRNVENRLKNEKEESVWETFWNLFAFQLMQYQESLGFFTNTGRFMLIVFGTCHLILFLGLYQSYLISALLQRSSAYPFTSLSGMVDAVAKGKYSLLKSPNGNWIYDEIDHSIAPDFENLRKALISNPFIPINASVETVETLEKGKYVMFNQIDGYDNLKVQERCNILTITEGLPQKTAHFLFQKNSPFINQFNKQIIMQQSFILRTYRKYFDSGFRLSQMATMARCSDAVNTEYRPLDLMDCIGLFVILFIGWTLAPFIIIAEILVFKYFNRLQKFQFPHVSQ